ncbi:MAG: thiamine-phosphate kinase [Thermodesulfobacteriota bacterium]
MQLEELGEFGFIARVAPACRIRDRGVVKGIGDDCAVVSMEGPDHLLVTKDLLVERVHFRLEWGSAENLGAKALAVNLSDIAACGGVPLDAFVGLAIPPGVDVEWLDGFYKGMTDLAAEYGVNLLGGDTTRSKTDLMISVTVTGTVPRDQVLFRHTARAGDLVVLTGPTGESAAGLEILLRGVPVTTELAQELIHTHLRPRPHVKEGRLLATSGACRAAIDVSDGLLSDLGHICQDSGLGAQLYRERIPVTRSVSEASGLLGKDALHWAFNGGEDYVLIAAVDPRQWDSLLDASRDAGCELTAIGEFVTGSEIVLQTAAGRVTPLTPRGWDHFR